MHAEGIWSDIVTRVWRLIGVWWKSIFLILGLIVVLIASLIVFGNILFRRMVESDVRKVFEGSRSSELDLITEDDIRDLPIPVQRYLKYTGILGKAKIETVKLLYKGSFRMRENQRGMPLKVEQYYTIDPPAFVWYGSIEPVPLISVKARDVFHTGKGNMLIKLLGLITVGEDTGPEIDQGTLVRYLSELIWFPSAALCDYIRWEPIDINSAKATIDYRGVNGSAVFHFNEKGEITNVVANRYMTDSGEHVLRKWSTPILDYMEANGVRVPSKGRAVWHLSSRDFTYIELEVTHIEYNNHSLF